VASDDWVGYYDAQAGRAPRELLMSALDSFEKEGRAGIAVDLGCGDGTDTAEMLARGWEVLSIDAQEDAIRRVGEKVPAGAAARSTTVVSPMEDATFPETDLVFASFSLPFCRPDAFPALWDRLRSSLSTGGRFAGELFGDRDGWASDPDMTFHDAGAAKALFDGLEMESFEEEEEDGEAFDGPKHWHVFHVIARQPSKR
jgi:tellurite methyltransferase